MTEFEVMQAAFQDELEKISGALGRAAELLGGGRMHGLAESEGVHRAAAKAYETAHGLNSGGHIMHHAAANTAAKELGKEKGKVWGARGAAAGAIGGAGFAAGRATAGKKEDKVANAAAEFEHGIHSLAGRIGKSARTGAGLGAGAGAAIGAAHGAAPDEEGGKHHVLRAIGHGALGAVGGGLAGGVAGAGASAARNYKGLSDLAHHPGNPANKVAAQLSDGNILKTYEELGGEYKEGGIGTMAMGGLEALAKHPGIATAGGAVLGAGAGALAGGPNHRLSGAVAGGAAGAGLGYGASKLDAGLTGMARKANPAGMAEVDMLHRHNEELQGYLKSQRAGA